MSPPPNRLHLEYFKIKYDNAKEYIPMKSIKYLFICNALYVSAWGVGGRGRGGGTLL